MLSLRQVSLLAAFSALALFPLPSAFAQGKGGGKNVEFKTSDGVTIKGTLYANAGGKRDAVVMLLHHFDAEKGGNRSGDNWPDLAQALYDDGYSVLSFDFRGFGESKEVSKDFWTHTHNGPGLIRRGAKPPEQIEYKKNFSSGYYPYLVNDIAAAKAYLDRRNDAKELNSSNVILIGAGQGATLGALWVANECRRHRDKNPNPLILTPQTAQIGDPESKDIACCVWLTIDQSIARRAVGGPLRSWLTEAGKTHKVAQLFVYGESDKAHDTYARGLVKDIKGTNKELMVGRIAVKGSSLKGSKLIDKTTNKSIIDELVKVIEGRGTKEQFERKAESSAYWYVNPRTKAKSLNKKPGVEVGPVNLNLFLQ